jgi:hypothetical protein
MSRKIALVFDCDGTIAEDSTERLLRSLGVDPKKFWANVGEMEKNGWEPTLAFMKLLLDFSNSKLNWAKKQRLITKKMFDNVGKTLRLSKGIPSFFREMKHYVQKKHGNEGVSLHIYVISGGIEDIIRASRINHSSEGIKSVDDIFGCRYAYGSRGEIVFPKCAITYTEKTKYLFAINKGISSDELAKDAYSANDYITSPDREIPLNNMIYIGDGPTDVACMSLLKKAGATVLGVYTPPRYGIPKKTFELASQGRITSGPYNRNYRTGSDLVRFLSTQLDGYADRVISEAKATRRPAVRH